MDERPVYRLIFAQWGAGIFKPEHVRRIKNEAAMGKNIIRR